MVDIGCLRQDVPFGLLVLILVCVSIIAGTGLFYINELEGIKVQNEANIARLSALEQQLILKEQQLESLRLTEQDILSDKEKMRSNLLNLESEYHTLRIEKVPVNEERSGPFSKAICKATGNAGC